MAIFPAYAGVGQQLYTGSLFHLSLSFAFSLFNPHSLMSLSTAWLHVVLGLPCPLLPSTLNDMIFFTQSSSWSVKMLGHY